MRTQNYIPLFLGPLNVFQDREEFNQQARKSIIKIILKLLLWNVFHNILFPLKISMRSIFSLWGKKSINYYTVKEASINCGLTTIFAISSLSISQAWVSLRTAVEISPCF